MIVLFSVSFILWLNITPTIWFTYTSKVYQPYTCCFGGRRVKMFPCSGLCTKGTPVSHPVSLTISFLSSLNLLYVHIAPVLAKLRNNKRSRGRFTCYFDLKKLISPARSSPGRSSRASCVALITGSQMKGGLRELEGWDCIHGKTGWCKDIFVISNTTIDLQHLRGLSAEGCQRLCLKLYKLSYVVQPRELA